eukprot:4864347-Heterocapsa_arctica.AAC.1
MKSTSKKAYAKFTTCFMDGNTFYKKYNSENIIKSGFLMETGESEWPFCALIAQSTHLLLLFRRSFGGRVGGSRVNPLPWCGGES